MYEIYKSLNSINDKLPKLKRYSLGTSTEQTALTLLEQLLMAKYAPKPHKATYLLKAQAQLETLRFKLRLYLELRLVNETRILQTQAKLQEIGRMLGGWLKSLT